MSKVYVCDECQQQKPRAELAREVTRYLTLEGARCARAVTTGRHVCLGCLEKIKQ